MADADAQAAKALRMEKLRARLEAVDREEERILKELAAQEEPRPAEPDIPWSIQKKDTNILLRLQVSPGFFRCWGVKRTSQHALDSPAARATAGEMSMFELGGSTVFLAYIHLF